MKLFFIFSLLAHAAAISDTKISFPVKEKQRLEGFLTSPSDNGLRPALLILLGSGRGSTDDVHRNYNPFREIAQRLASQGAVVLRFDKRGTGYNEDKGPFELQSFQDYVHDSQAALNFLQSVPMVDPNRIYVLGHSMGTLVATELAAKFGLKGLILSSGPSESVISLMKEQQEFMNSVLYANDPKLAEAQTEALLQPYKNILEGRFRFSECGKDRCKMLDGVEVLDGQSLQFWNELLSKESGSELSKLKPGTSVLCLGGGADWVVASHHAESNCEKINGSHYVFPDLDHFLSVSPSREASLQTFLKRDLNGLRLNESYFKKIADWVRE